MTSLAILPQLSGVWFWPRENSTVSEREVPWPARVALADVMIRQFGRLPYE